MRCWVRVAILFLSALAGIFGMQQPAVAEPRAITVSFAQTASGIRVSYELPAPVTSLALRPISGRRPASNIHVPDGMTLAGQVISSARPTRRFTLDLTPDSREVDAVYPLMTQVDRRGAIVYAPYLLPRAGVARIELIDSGGSPRALGPEEAEGYVIVGAPAHGEGRYRSLIADSAPASLRAVILQRTGQLLDYFQSRLGRPSVRSPTIVLAYAERGRGANGGVFRGDVTPNGVVFMRIYGDPSHPDDPALATRPTGFLAHELFHLWNRSRDPVQANWWLHEGGAEYASWIAISSLWPGEAVLETRINGALQSCAMYLGAKSLSSLSDLESRSLRYPCGAVMQWLVDLGVRDHSRGDDILTFWRRLLSATGHSAGYTPAGFRARIAQLAPRSVVPTTMLLDETGIDRWTRLADLLNLLGARVEVEPPAPFLLRLAAARALVLSACGEVDGVGENADGLFVQAPGECAVFGDSPVIESADSIPVMADPRGFYEAVRGKCAAGTEVILTLKASGQVRTARVRCTAAIEPPPPTLRVVRALGANRPVPSRDDRRVGLLLAIQVRSGGPDDPPMRDQP